MTHFTCMYAFADPLTVRMLTCLKSALLCQKRHQLMSSKQLSSQSSPQMILWARFCCLSSCAEFLFDRVDYEFIYFQLIRQNEIKGVSNLIFFFCNYRLYLIWRRSVASSCHLLRTSSLLHNILPSQSLMSSPGSSSVFSSVCKSVISPSCNFSLCRVISAIHFPLAFLHFFTLLHSSIYQALITYFPYGTTFLSKLHA